MQKYYFLLSKS